MGQHPNKMTSRHWQAVIGAGCLMAMAVLMFLSAGLLLPQLAVSLKIGLTQVMAFSSISFLTQALVMSVFGARLTARYGTRAVVIAGGAFSGAMIFTVSFVTTLPALYALALASGLPFAIVTQLSSTVLINEWFHKRRGFMLGLVMSIAGLGGVIAGSVLPQVVASGGWQLGFQMVGVLIVATTVLTGIFLIRSTPADVGLQPYGGARAHGTELLPPTEQVSAGTAAAAIRTPKFAALVLGLLGLNMVMALQQHFPPMMYEHGLSITAAGSLISVLALVNIGTTLLTGMLIDRRGPLTAYLVAAALLVAALVVFGSTHGYLPQLAGVLLFAMSSVTPPLITPIAFRHAFGKRAYAALLGVGLATMPVGIAIGSPAWGLAKDLTGTYASSLVIAMATAVASAGLVAYALHKPAAPSPSEVIPARAPSTDVSHTANE
jgi:MFS transporter, OFA family, oxalate/formate antiporter